MNLPSAVFEDLLGKFPRNRRDEKKRRTDRDYVTNLIDITEPPSHRAATAENRPLIQF